MIHESMIITKVFINYCFLFLITDPSTIRLGCDDDNTPEDYELQDLKRKSILRGHNGPIYDVTFMPRSKYVLSVSEDTTMRLWDLETGINKAMYQGHSYPIWSVDSDRVGVNIATGKLDSIFFIFYCIDVEFQVHFLMKF